MATTDRRGVSVDATDTAIAGSPNPGLAIKAPCFVATTANITLSGLQTIDGVAVAAGNRVLVKSQTDKTTNGLYNASTGPWTRTVDFASNGDVADGMQVFVTQGATQGNAFYTLETADPITLGTTQLTFTIISVGALRSINTAAPLTGGGNLTADRTLSITANGVTYSLLQQVSASKILGNPTGGSANVSEIALGATLSFSGTAVQTGAGTGDVAWSANSFATTIQPNAVTGAKFRQSAGLSVVGNSSNATGNVADITGAANLVLVVNAAGTSLTFGQVTYAGIQNVSASRLLGNPTGAGASAAEISLGATLTFSGSSVQTVAFTGDVTTAANSFVTTIAAGAVSNSKMANMAAWTIKGNATSGSAAPADFTVDGLTLKASHAAGDEILIWDVAGGAMKKATVSSVGSSSGVSSVNGQVGAIVAYQPPQGRLTLSSGTPVMGSTVSGATSVLYTPYVGALCVIYDGTNMVPTVFPELSNVLANSSTGNAGPAAAAASSVYDLFVWNNGGTVTLTRGPAWTNDTTRSAGTALVRVNGVWMNNASITNGPAAQRGTYVGTIRTNGSATVDWIFGASASGGTAGFLGVWNAYNRVEVATTVVDSGAQYSYTSNTTRQARASSGNQISFVVGLQEDGLTATYTQRVTWAAVSGATLLFGIGFDTTTSYSVRLVLSAPTAAGASTSNSLAWPTRPGIGLHFVAALEQSDNTNANFFDSDSLATLGLTFKM